MKPRHWVMAVIAVLAAGGAAAAGCGSSSDDKPTVDAGGDAIADAVVTDQATGDACAVDADIGGLTLSDAATGTNGSSPAACLACAQTQCKNEIGACQGTCSCRGAVVSFFQCIAGGSTIIRCAQDAFLSSTDDLRGVGQDLGFCVVANCARACSLSGGTDAALPDAAIPDDAASDASDDATSTDATSDADAASSSDATSSDATSDASDAMETSTDAASSDATSDASDAAAD